MDSFGFSIHHNQCYSRAWLSTTIFIQLLHHCHNVSHWLGMPLWSSTHIPLELPTLKLPTTDISGFENALRCIFPLIPNGHHEKKRKFFCQILHALGCFVSCDTHQWVSWKKMKRNCQFEHCVMPLAPGITGFRPWLWLQLAWVLVPILPVELAVTL